MLSPKIAQFMYLLFSSGNNQTVLVPVECSSYQGSEGAGVYLSKQIPEMRVWNETSQICNTVCLYTKSPGPNFYNFFKIILLNENCYASSLNFKNYYILKTMVDV